MKKILIVLLSLMVGISALSAEEKKVSVSGRVMMELAKTNNMDDFTDYKDGMGNDTSTYGDGRVDLKVKAKINQKVTAKVSTRFEGKLGGEESGDKFMDFGGQEGDQLKDATLALQEAYIQIKKLFGLPVFLKMGRQSIDYGNGNIVDDKYDALTLNTDLEAFYANLHYVINKNHGSFETAEGTDLTYTLGVNGGMNNVADMVDINAYLWKQNDSNIDTADTLSTVADSKLIFGLRLEAKLMNGNFKPFAELAIQSGSDGQDEGKDYSGTLIDLGAKIKYDLGAVTVDGIVEYFMASGDDAETGDESEKFGIGMSGREEGWNTTEVANDSNTMIKLGAGLVPKSMEALHLGLNYWKVADNTTNFEDASGENQYNEINLHASYKITKKTKLFTGLSIISPNEDYPEIGEDSANAMYFGTQVKF